MLYVENLKKIYTFDSGQQVVFENLTWSLDQDKFVSIYGKSGSGKSTFLNILSGIDKPDMGHVYFMNKKIYDLSDYELSHLRLNYFGFIFQTFNLISTLNIFENIEYPLVLLKLSKKERERKVSEALENVGLAECAKKLPSQVSGGQRQRAAIARALVKEPKIIFADEPTANLDEKTSKDILDLIFSLQKRNHMNMIYVTHDPDISKYSEKSYYLTQRTLKPYV